MVSAFHDMPRADDCLCRSMLDCLTAKLLVSDIQD